MLKDVIGILLGLSAVIEIILGTVALKVGAFDKSHRDEVRAEWLHWAVTAGLIVILILSYLLRVN